MNPFLRRATEYLRDTASFLQITSPEPLSVFIGKHERINDLFDLPVRIVGSPGTGKTMLATLVEFRTLEAVLLDQSNPNNRELTAAFNDAKFADGDVPRVAAVRLPMESEYRDFWELPYDPAIKTKLMLTLIQARAMISFYRNLTANGRRHVADIGVATREEAGAQVAQIGGPHALDQLGRAREVDAAVYSIGSSLIPPNLEDIPEAANAPYQPFEAIKEFLIEWDGHTVPLRPLIILDDVHTLHPDQLSALMRALARREIRMGRWMMMRMDSLSPHDILRSSDEDFGPGLKAERDYVDIYLQNVTHRRMERRRFRSMAGDMANRYLRFVPALRERGIDSFSATLSRSPPKFSAANMRDLETLLNRDQASLEITESRREQLAEDVTRYVANSKAHDITEELRLAMLRVLMHRHAGRVSGTNLSFFDDPDPVVEVKAKPQIVDAARVHLYHLFGRPLHYGLEDLCDASNENAELFLQLAGTLVDKVEAKVIRRQTAELNAQQQQEVLTQRANEIIEKWSFPYARRVKLLVQEIGRRCVENAKLPNAPLGGGATSFGILERELVDLLRSERELLSVLKFAVAYGALTAVRHYGQGGKDWCLFELSGLVRLAYGLDLGRGSFLECTVSEIEAASEGVA